MGTSVLSLEVLRFGNRCMIANGTIYDLKDITKKHNNPLKQRTMQEIRNFLDSNRPGQFYLVEKSHKRYKNSKPEKFKAILQFLFRNLEKSKQYKYYGRTKKNVLTKGPPKIPRLKSQDRAAIPKSNVTYVINQPFVYFP